MLLFRKVFPISENNFMYFMCILRLIFKDLRLEINLVMHVEKAKDLDKNPFIILSEIFLS